MRWVLASASEVSCTNFLDVRSTSVACFVSSRTPGRLSQVARCFQMLGTSLSKNNMGRLPLLLLLLCSPITLLRDLGCWPWCCEPFENYSISVLRSHTINAVSWPYGESDDCKWFCIARIAILDPALLIIFPKNWILIVVPETACRALSFSVPPGMIPLPKKDWNSTKFLCERCTPSICME